MWIRSQNKMTLVNASSISAYKAMNAYHLSAYDTNGKSHDIGEYGTITRAVEILDEIQMVMSEQYTQIASSDNNGSVYTAMNVYQMPEK